MDTRDSKFNRSQINEIVKLRKQGNTLTKLAKIYNVYPSTIDRICKRQKPKES